MSYKKWAMPLVVLIVASLALTACPAPTPPVARSAPTVTVEPTAAPTVILPTATPTAVEPIATPTVVAPTEPAADTSTLLAVRLKPIGHPTWKPVDFHLFAAPFGPNAELGATARSILPEPNHRSFPDVMVGPGAPHAPPYTTELAAGVVASGFHEGVRFTTSEFSEGMGIFLAWMNVPAPGTTGSSPDFASGPIIANRLFPVWAFAGSTHNGRTFDPDLSHGVYAPNENGFNVDGASHFPVFVATNADWGPSGAPLAGSYTYKIEMRDAVKPAASFGDGWLIEVDFTIAP